jgi:hypothetical protein
MNLKTKRVIEISGKRTETQDFDSVFGFRIPLICLGITMSYSWDAFILMDVFFQSWRWYL